MHIGRKKTILSIEPVIRDCLSNQCSGHQEVQLHLQVTDVICSTKNCRVSSLSAARSPEISYRFFTTRTSSYDLLSNRLKTFRIVAHVHVRTKEFIS